MLTLQQSFKRYSRFNNPENLTWFVKHLSYRQIVNCYVKIIFQSAINPFNVTGLFLHPLKTSKNLWFSDVFRGYRKRQMVWNGLIHFAVGMTRIGILETSVWLTLANNIHLRRQTFISTKHLNWSLQYNVTTKNFKKGTTNHTIAPSKWNVFGEFQEMFTRRFCNWLEKPELKEALKAFIFTLFGQTHCTKLWLSFRKLVYATIYKEKLYISLYKERLYISLYKERLYIYIYIYTRKRLICISIQGKVTYIYAQS